MRRLAPLALVLLAGCSNLYNTYAGDRYVVRAGDTLYSIAWRHGVDARELAAWNGLADPDRIYVGQRLALAPTAGRSAAARNPATSASRSGVPAPASGASASSRPSASAVAPSWRWPVSGRVVARFGEPRVLATGIAIAGSPGADVRAAAAGRVVYVGSGLPDYGQLVIIEHNGSWVSAYGLNRRIVVGQGQSVSQGEKIAEMGQTAAGGALLHFEIRRNGDPLDPLSVLPASS
jgi:lipoprotein NlpD